MSKNLSKLRTIIQESLRVQRGSAEQVAYIDTGNVLSDVCARQNHVIFARRGCGKTLLLHYSARQLGEGIHSVYLKLRGIQTTLVSECAHRDSRRSFW